jgi:hypothetical protein
MTDSAFLDVPQSARPTTAGEVKLPILHADASLFQAFFRADARAARRALDGTGLEPVLLFRRALVVVAFFEHRDASIGPYAEAALALLVRRASDRRALGLVARDLRSPAADRRLGFHVLHLPVTTTLASTAGRELWGLPGFVADIPIDFTPGRFRGEVVDPTTGEPLVVLQGRVPAGLPVAGLDLVLYSELEGALLKTVAAVEARLETSLGRELRLRVGPSVHPMAEAVRALGLDGASPFVVQRSLSYEARLPLGRRVA